MNKKLFIKNWVKFSGSKVIRNGKTEFESEKTNLSSFLKEVYRGYKLNYPKFYKMDTLSKLGFLGTEILSEGHIEDKQTALIFANSASSLETDEDFLESMGDFPSPGIFVYTLPNIVLGEISIRHKLRSENLFMVEESFCADLFVDYCKSLFQQEKASNFVCGWVDLHNKDYDVFLWQLAPDGHLALNEKELNKLYLSSHE